MIKKRAALYKAHGRNQKKSKQSQAHDAENKVNFFAVPAHSADQAHRTHGQAEVRCYQCDDQEKKYHAIRVDSGE